MPAPVKDTPPCGLVAHNMRGKRGNKPVYAWDDPNQHDSSLPDGKYNGPVCVNEDNIFGEKACQQQQQQQQASFYDREALQEKLHGLEVERSSLSEREYELRERLEKAQATLSSMRSKKRQLSTAKLLDQVENKAGGNNCCSDQQRSCLSRDGIRYRQQEEHRKDGRLQRQDDNNVRLYLQDIDFLAGVHSTVEQIVPKRRHAWHYIICYTSTVVLTDLLPVYLNTGSILVPNPTP